MRHIYAVFGRIFRIGRQGFSDDRTFPGRETAPGIQTIGRRFRLPVFLHRRPCRRSSQSSSSCVSRISIASRLRRLSSTDLLPDTV